MTPILTARLRPTHSIHKTPAKTFLWHLFLHHDNGNFTTGSSHTSPRWTLLCSQVSLSFPSDIHIFKCLFCHCGRIPSKEHAAYKPRQDLFCSCLWDSGKGLWPKLPMSSSREFHSARDEHHCTRDLTLAWQSCKQNSTHTSTLMTLHIGWTRVWLLKQRGCQPTMYSTGTGCSQCCPCSWGRLLRSAIAEVSMELLSSASVSYNNPAWLCRICSSLLLDLCQRKGSIASWTARSRIINFWLFLPSWYWNTS